MVYIADPDQKSTSHSHSHSHSHSLREGASITDALALQRSNAHSKGGGKIIVLGGCAVAPQSEVTGITISTEVGDIISYHFIAFIHSFPPLFFSPSPSLID
jgi:hypothetical protein